MSKNNLNEMKRELEKIRKANEKRFTREWKSVQSKVNKFKEARDRRMPSQINLKQELEDLRESWIEERISKDRPIPLPPTVNIYGEVTLDKDEVACAALGPKFTEYPILEQKSMKFESILAHTKTRYSRIGTGGPIDQAKDLEEFGDNSDLTDEV